MKKLTVKEIKEMNAAQLEKMMTEKEWDRMHELNFEQTWMFLESLQESAELSNQEDNEEHISISEYLDYLEEIEESKKEVIE